MPGVGESKSGCSSFKVPTSVLGFGFTDLDMRSIFLSGSSQMAIVGHVEADMDSLIEGSAVSMHPDPGGNAIQWIQ